MKTYIRRTKPLGYMEKSIINAIVSDLLSSIVERVNVLSEQVGLPPIGEVTEEEILELVRTRRVGGGNLQARRANPGALAPNASPSGTNAPVHP